MNNQRKIGAVLSYIAIVANTLIQLLYTPFLIFKIGQNEYGIYSLVSSIIGYLTVLDLGFGNAIIVHTIKYKVDKNTKKEQKLHGMFHVIYIIIGIISAIVGIILSLYSANIFSQSMSTEEIAKISKMFLILSFNLLITFSFSIYSSIITANEQFVFQKAISLIGIILKPILMVPLLFLGYKSITLCIVITAINLSISISNWLFCRYKLKTRIKFHGFDKKLLLAISSYSIWIFINQIVDKVNWSVDQFILGIISGAIAVSVYSAASTLNTMFINLSTAISGVMLPKITRMIAENKSAHKLTNELTKIGRIQFYIIYLTVSGLIIFGKPFIRLWLGESFNEAYQIALILIIPLCFPLMQNLGLSILQAMNKYKFKAISTLVMSVFNIIISVILARKYGATGAAIGTAMSIIICNIIIMNVYYSKVIKLEVSSFWKEIIALLALSLIPTLTYVLVIPKLNIDNWINLIINIITYSLLYLVYIYIFCFNSYEKKMINTMIVKFRKGIH